MYVQLCDSCVRLGTMSYACMLWCAGICPTQGMVEHQPWRVTALTRKRKEEVVNFYAIDCGGHVSVFWCDFEFFTCDVFDAQEEFKNTNPLFYVPKTIFVVVSNLRNSFDGSQVDRIISAGVYPHILFKRTTTDD
jgi:hypothetical protein